MPDPRSPRAAPGPDAGGAPPRPPVTLAARLALWFGGANLLVTVAALLAVSLYGRSLAQGWLAREAAASAEAVAQGIEARLRLAENLARMVAMDCQDGGFEPGQLHPVYLRSLLEASPDLCGAELTWASGRGGAGSEAQAVGTGALPVPDRDWPPATEGSGRPAWSRARRLASGARVQSCGLPLLQGGLRVGTFRVDLSLSRIAAALPRGQLTPDGYLFALDRSGGLLLSTCPTEALEAGLAGASPGGQGPGADPGAGGLVRVEADPLRGEAAWVHRQELGAEGATLWVVHPEDELLGRVRHAQLLVGLAALLYTAVLMALVWLVARAVSRPIRALQRAAERVSRGELDRPVPALATRDELSLLPAALNRIMADLRDQLARLQEAERARERIAGELELARRIQAGLLDPARWPAVPGLSVQARCQQAESIGGDFYDVFEIGGGRVALALGDSSGHGMAAALFMAVCRTLIRACAREGGAQPGVGGCLEAVNRRLCEENEAVMFVTGIHAALDVRRGVLSLGCAGHPAPYRVRADGEIERLALPVGPPLGVLAAARYPVHEIRLAPGDRLVLFSDGLVEAEAPDGSRFGAAALEASLRETAGQGGEAVSARIAEAVARFTEGAAPSDDRTWMVVTWAGPRLELPARLEHLPEAWAWLEAALPVGGRAGLVWRLVLEEALVNVIRHGGLGDGDRIELALELSSEGAALVLEEGGIAFDPTAPQPAPAPDQLGGRGLALLRRSLDEFSYRRVGGRNLLRMGRRWAPGQGPAQELGAPGQGPAQEG